MDNLSRPTSRRGFAPATALLLVMALATGAVAADVTPAEAYGTATQTAATPLRANDVRPGSVHAEAIAAMAQAGVTSGCAPDRFCPSQPATREQIASMLARAFELPPAATDQVFGDVPRTSVHAWSIQALVSAGLARGCSPDRFCPRDTLTRAQAASILAAVYELEPTGKTTFLDVRGGVHSPAILALADAGLTMGCEDGRFCGNRPLTRAQFATFLYRAQVGVAPREPGGSGGPVAGPSGPVAAPSAPTGTGGVGVTPPAAKLTEAAEPQVAGGVRLLYSDADVVRFGTRMSLPGPFFASGDAGQGGAFSPNDGQRALGHARAFLADPKASYWSQPSLPMAPGDPAPRGTVYARPMHAAWVAMTQPDPPDREKLVREVKTLLLTHAKDPTLQFGNSTNYPVRYHGAAPSPSFDLAQWLTRLIKARDMLGREAFTPAENEIFDRWIYDYANWAANWFEQGSTAQYLPGRLNRDYSRVNLPANAHRRSYDGGPLIGAMGMAYSNRHAAIMSTMSLAANYLKHFGYVAPTSGGSSYEQLTVDQLVDHSRLFVEETLRFSVWPQGVQGDFERGDSNYHGAASPQQGWLYSANVLANLLEMAEYHAKRGDMSVWRYGTVEGYDGSAGVPVAGGFTQKNLHFYAWFMSRYVNDGWKRTNRNQPLALPHFYHDVIPAAMAHRLAPNDTLLRDAWRRSGSGFPAYPQHPQSQGPYHAHDGEGGKFLGLIEHAG
jgi:hypothetical protein